MLYYLINSIILKNNTYFSKFLITIYYDEHNIDTMFFTEYTHTKCLHCVKTMLTRLLSSAKS